MGQRQHARQPNGPRSGSRPRKPVEKSEAYNLALVGAAGLSAVVFPLAMLLRAPGVRVAPPIILVYPALMFLVAIDNLAENVSFRPVVRWAGLVILSCAAVFVCAWWFIEGQHVSRTGGAFSEDGPLYWVFWAGVVPGLLAAAYGSRSETVRRWSAPFLHLLFVFVGIATVITWIALMKAILEH